LILVEDQQQRYFRRLQSSERGTVLVPEKVLLVSDISDIHSPYLKKISRCYILWWVPCQLFCNRNSFFSKSATFFCLRCS